jgi:hypothetical protein
MVGSWQDAEGVKGWPSNQLRRSSAAPAGSGNSRLGWIELLNQEPEGLRLFENLGDKESVLERIGVHALAHGRTGLRFAEKG